MDAYNLIKSAMSVSNARAELISSNIANVNTPNYKAKRVEFESEVKKALENANQAMIKADNMMPKPKITENAKTSLKDNGNNVDLEVEMMNQATNGLYYSALTAQMNGRLQMMNYVLSH